MSTDGVVLGHSPGLITASSSFVIILVEAEVRHGIFLEQFANPFQLVQSNLVDTAVIFLLNLKEGIKRRFRLCSPTYADPAQERSTKGEERSEPGEDVSDDVTDDGQVGAAVRVGEQAEEEGGERSHNTRHDGGDDQDGVGGWCRL